MFRIAGIDLRDGARLAIRRGKGYESFGLALPSCPEGLAGEFKKRGLKIRRAAVVLRPEDCCCRKIASEFKTKKQIEANLPYEFRDYLKAPPESYVFDYAVLGEGAGILAAAAPKERIEALRSAFSREGINLVSAIPAEAAYSNLMLGNLSCAHRHCVIEAKSGAVRIFMSDGGRYEWTYSAEYGGEGLVSIVERALRYLSRSAPVAHIHLASGDERLKAALSEALGLPVLGCEEFCGGFGGFPAALGAVLGGGHQ